LGPLARGSIVVLDVYSSALYGTNAAAGITPAPRVSEEQLSLAGADSRVTWWIPALGDRHPAMLLVNGATPLGNDDPETRRIAEALARAGYLVMLPEFPFLKEARLERGAPARVDAAFAAMLRRSDADPDHAGAFGFSVGGGIMLAAAGLPGAALGRARYLGALGAYFDIRTYLASVVTGTQRRHGALEPWSPDPEARLKLPLGAADALGDASDRDRVTAAIRASGGPLAPDPPAGLGEEARGLWLALAETDFDRALGRLDALPAGLRGSLEALSPSTAWRDVRAPVYWIHDVGDRFEPVSEGESALAAPHDATTRLHLTRLLSHAAALAEGSRQQGLDFWATELSGLLGFAVDVLKRAG
jgi:dienelactone hydrolase